MLYNLVNMYLDACAAGRKDEASTTYKSYLRAARKLDTDPVEYMMKARRMRKELQHAKNFVRNLRAA